MSLDVYFKDNVENNIVSHAVGMLRAYLRNGSINDSYCSGVLDYAISLAIAYGICIDVILERIESGLNIPLPDIMEKRTRLNYAVFSEGPISVGR